MTIRNIRTFAVLLPALLGINTIAFGQNAPLTWRRVGGFTVNEGLASPSSGPVRALWYTDGGARLLAQTDSGRIFETSDFEHWRLNTSAVADTPAATGTQRLYAARADNLYASDDNGRTWINLTGFNDHSVIGGEFSSIAVSPSDPRQVTAANGHGIWRSLDGGLSWRGLNDNLPNLQVRKLIGRRKAVLENGSLVALDSGVWNPHPDTDPEQDSRIRAAAKVGVAVTSAARSNTVQYAGLADGRMAVSRDAWATSTVFGAITGIAVDRIQADPDKSDAALAIAGTRLYRTVNGGLFWDDVTAGLPQSLIHGLAADRLAGVVYLATDRGLYTGAISLNDAGPVSPNWTLLSRDLPAASVWDVRLNSDNTLTVAVDGYGVFETAGIHRSRGVHVVNGADMTDRAAAPGSLISVIGANVARGRAGDLTFPVLAGSDDSSQLQVPFEASPGAVRVALEGPLGRWSVPLTVRDASPTIFIDSDGAPVLLDSSSGVNLDSKVAVHAGESVQILATGLGRVTPDWPSGVAAPLDSPPAVRGTVTAFLDGTPLEVTHATLAPGYVGYYIVEMRVPRIVNRGPGELRLVMNGEESNRVRLYLESDLALR